jgi:DNA-binding NarL/FixJ family response regulator
MRTAVVAGQPRRNLSLKAEAERLGVIVADGSSRSLATVFAVLEFDDMVDVVGWASNFEETIELARRRRPDLVVLNIEMASANLAMEAILLSAPDTKIVGISATDSIPLEAPSLILSFNALVHASRLQEEFLPVLHALFGDRAPLSPPRVWPSAPEPSAAAGQRTAAHTRNQPFKEVR